MALYSRYRSKNPDNQPVIKLLIQAVVQNRWKVLLFVLALGLGLNQLIASNNYLTDFLSATQKKVIKSTNIDNYLPKLDLVVILSGELGNNLLLIAYGHVIKSLALEERRFNFTLRYVQGYSKNKVVREEVQKCFSKHWSEDKVNMAEWTLDSQEWKDITQNQSIIVQRFFADWDDPTQASKLLEIGGPFGDFGDTFDSIRSHLDHLSEVMNRIKQEQQNESYSNNSFIIKNEVDGREIMDRHRLSLPFLVSSVFPRIPLMDRYWDEIAELFTFNDTECCLDLPEANETVLHIRAFDNELRPRTYHNLGFRELDPNQTSSWLLGHLNAGDKVAIVGRTNTKYLSKFIEPLEERGLQVRFVTPNHNGVQDFCFLKYAAKEIIGHNMSSYFIMAAMLNVREPNVTIYCYNYPPNKVCTNHPPVTNEWLVRKTWNFPIL